MLPFLFAGLTMYAVGEAAGRALSPVTLELGGKSPMVVFLRVKLVMLLRPLLGDVIDWLGERKVLATDEIMLLVVATQEDAGKSGF